MLASISRAVVRIVHEYTGRGPTKARTVIAADTISIILADTLTRGEQSLVEMGEGEHVFHTRRNYQKFMREDLVELVESSSGRTVKAFFSDNHIDPDYAVEFFLLEPMPGETDLDPPPNIHGDRPVSLDGNGDRPVSLDGDGDRPVSLDGDRPASD